MERMVIASTCTTRPGPRRQWNPLQPLDTLRLIRVYRWQDRRWKIHRHGDHVVLAQSPPTEARTQQAAGAMTGLVGFRVTVRNMLPESLAEVYRRHGHTAQADQAGAEAREAARIGLALTRTVELPGVPGVGDQVWANPNWEPVQVIAVEWNLDPGAGEPHVVVTLDDLDEDEVGTEWGAIEVLLDSGWTPELDL